MSMQQLWAVPIASAVVSLGLFIWGWRRENDSIAFPAAVWLGFALLEGAIQSRLLCDEECNIRIDLFLVPILAIWTLSVVVKRIGRERDAAQLERATATASPHRSHALSLNRLLKAPPALVFAAVFGLTVLGWGIAKVVDRDSGRQCTMELGISIPPRTTVIAPGGVVRLKAETTTCSGTIRGVPAGLTWASDDPSVVSVDQSGRAQGVAPGAAVVSATLDKHGPLWNFHVEVSDPGAREHAEGKT